MNIVNHYSDGNGATFVCGARHNSGFVWGREGTAADCVACREYVERNVQCTN